MLATNIGAARDFTTVYNGAAGSAKRMADIMDNTLTGSFFKVRSAVESAMIALGEEMAPTIRGLPILLQSLFQNLKIWIPVLKNGGGSWCFIGCSRSFIGGVRFINDYRNPRTYNRFHGLKCCGAGKSLDCFSGCPWPCCRCYGFVF